MKKVIIIIGVVIVVGILGAFAVPFFVADEIAKCNTEVISHDENSTLLISHETNSGELIDSALSVNECVLSEKYYKYEFLFNQIKDAESEGNYDVSVLKVTLDLGVGDSVSEAFASSGGSIYNVVTANNGKLSYSVDGNYLHLTVLMYREYGDEEIDVNLQYSIDGKGLYCRNCFDGMEHNLTI